MPPPLVTLTHEDLDLCKLTGRDPEDFRRHKAALIACGGAVPLGGFTADAGTTYELPQALANGLAAAAEQEGVKPADLLAKVVRSYLEGASPDAMAKHRRGFAY